MAALRLILLHAALAAFCSAAVEIRFVPPAGEGTVSLGIFDEQNRLVRVICDEWPLDRFRVGLNGLSTTWDGRDSAGTPVARGLYRARGYLVGAVEVEGEALLFNDWAVQEGSPRIVSVAALSILPGGDLLLAARLTGDRGALIRCSPQAEARWRIVAEEPLEGRGGAVKLASAADRAFLLFAGRLLAVDLQTGRELAPAPALRSARDVSAGNGRIAVLDDAAVRLFDAKDLSPQGSVPLPPVEPAAIALLNDGSLAAAGNDGSLWYHGKNWVRLDIPSGAAVRALAPGRESTFWAAEAENDAITFVQYSPEEGRLAEWRSAAHGEGVLSLAASNEADYFAAVLDSPARNRTVAVRRTADGSRWELVADKSITESSSFGWTGAAISPDSGELPLSIEVPLAPNPLDPSAPNMLTLLATSGAEGTGLRAADGLPVLRVSDRAGFTRVLVAPGTTASVARFFQGDGAGVEEYALRNLGDITAFDAGAIEMEGGAEKPAPPDEEEPAAMP